MILLNGLHAVRTASLFGLMNSCQGFVLAGAGRSITARGRQIGSSRSVSTFGNNRPLVVDSGRPDVCSIPGDREFNGGVLSMSVRDMIGADVETGGLFDPLGESSIEGTNMLTIVCDGTVMKQSEHGAHRLCCAVVSEV